jgi:hypothetical protein
MYTVYTQSRGFLKRIAKGIGWWKNLFDKGEGGQ